MDALPPLHPDNFDPGSYLPGTVENSESGRRQGTKRKKYAAKACHDCKRRKVRCSGDEICQQCYDKNLRCCYSPPPPLRSNKQFEEARSNRSRGNGSNSNPSCANGSQVAVPQARDSESSSATYVSATPLDPRFDGLCNRVQALERMLNHLLKSFKVTEESSPVATFPTPATQAGAPDEDDANMFAVRVTAPDDLSLSSQVAAMGALLSRPPSPGPSKGKPKVGAEILIEFPDASTLQHLLDVYFRDMDNYFPFLNRQITESSIYNVIRRLGYSSYNRMLVVPMEDLSIVALACIMLALAECLDSGEGACDGDARPGWEKYLQSCRALQHSSHSKWLDLHIVSTQCLVAAYLMHCEILDAASEAISAAWKLALSLRLNNTRTWTVEDTERTLQKQRLWWIIYFLDRQISRRSGIAYHIRDTEHNVDDFENVAAVVDVDLMSQADWQTSITSSYLQALINSARLWGHAWDTFFAVGATKRGDWMEVEITDARILNTRRQLPKALTWNSDELENYSLNHEDEPHIRRRLQLYTRLELLRMLIRQNPVRQTVFDPETAHLCARLSREIIRAHHLYVLRFPEARAVGYFTTSSTVECIYHLAPVMRYSAGHSEHTASITAFHQAQDILVRLSAYNSVAKKALRALKGLAKKWGSSATAGKSGNYTALGREDFGDSNAIGSGTQIHEFHGNNIRDRRGGFDVDLGNWMDTSMGSLIGTEFDLGLTPTSEELHARTIHFNNI